MSNDHEFVPLAGWIIAGSRVVTSTAIASSRKDRRRGLRGALSVPYPLVIERCRWVHSFGMKITIEVIYLDKESRILKIQTLRPHRLASPVLRATYVVETEVGAFRRWNLQVGDTIEVRASYNNAQEGPRA